MTLVVRVCCDALLRELHRIDRHQVHCDVVGVDARGIQLRRVLARIADAQAKSPQLRLPARSRLQWPSDRERFRRDDCGGSGRLARSQSQSSTTPKQVTCMWALPEQTRRRLFLKSPLTDSNRRPPLYKSEMDP